MENALGEAQTIVLLGGTSDIGRAIVDRLVAADDADDRARRAATSRRCASRSSSARVSTSRQCTSTPPIRRPTTGWCATSPHAHGDLDVVVLAFGQLVEQAELDDDPAAGGGDGDGQLHRAR